MFRTGQEESRHILVHNMSMNFERNESDVLLTNVAKSYPKDLLPTNTCIYIHGTLIATLFVVAITR